MATKKAPRKKKSPNYRLYDLKKADQFALCDAMRYAIILIFVPSSPNDLNCSYIHAFEVGRDPRVLRVHSDAHLVLVSDGNDTLEEVIDALPVLVGGDAAGLGHGVSWMVLVELPGGVGGIAAAGVARRCRCRKRT